MSFTGNESETVTLDEASRWAANFRNANPNAVKAHFFGKNKLQEVISQTGCVGLRMYNGIDDNGADVLIIVGVKSDETDMTGGVILEKSNPCPPFCDSTSALMK